MTPTFRIADAAGGGPCSPGFTQALGLFDQAREYTLLEMIDAGLEIENVEWIVWQKVRTDTATLGAVRLWAAALGCEDVASMAADACSTAIRGALRDHARDLARAGKSPQVAARLTRTWCRNAMIAAFA